MVDVEDAVQMGALSFAEAEALLAPLAEIQPAIYGGLQGIERKLTYLRARAISTLIASTAAVWRDQHDRMLAGEAIAPLLGQTAHQHHLAMVRSISRQKIYRGSARADTVLIANRTITVLLDNLAGMLLRREQAADDTALSIHDQAILAILSRYRELPSALPRDRAGWVRELMDHIAALTEPAAMFEARLLTGGLG